jgi:hypothetical protein
LSEEKLKKWKARARKAEHEVEALKAMLHRMNVSEDRIAKVLERATTDDEFTERDRHR